MTPTCRGCRGLLARAFGHHCKGQTVYPRCAIACDCPSCHPTFTHADLPPMSSISLGFHHPS